MSSYSRKMLVCPRRQQLWVELIMVLFLHFGVTQVTSFSAAYLNTLAIGNTPDNRPPGPESIVPEEYYGFTNPMANCFPGSKHEQYGGYLRNINGNSSSDGGRRCIGSKDNDGATSSTNDNQKSYLESLNTMDTSTSFLNSQF